MLVKPITVILKSHNNPDTGKGHSALPSDHEHRNLNDALIYWSGQLMSNERGDYKISEDGASIDWLVWGFENNDYASAVFFEVVG